MNLDDEYNPAHRHAVELQGKFHDFVRQAPTAYNPQDTVLQHEIHTLVGELESRKEPQAIENRIKIIQRGIRDAQIRGDSMLHYEHLNDLQRHSEILRQQMRRFRNY